MSKWTDEIQSLVDDLIQKHKDLGMKASGNWIDSVEYKTTESKDKYTAEIWAEDYTEQLVDGRKNGKFPPKENIIQWIKDKGLTYDIPIESLAFLIARKIAREGTEYFKQGGTDLLDAVFTKSREEQIVRNMELELFGKISEVIDFDNI